MKYDSKTKTMDYSNKKIEHVHGIKISNENGYTPSAWKGAMYDSSLSMKEIGGRVRFFLKKQYPDCRFSVTIENYAGGSSMHIRLMQANFDVFAIPSIEDIDITRYCKAEEQLKNWNYVIEKGHTSINEYVIEKNYLLTPKAKEVLKFMSSCATVYIYDDSDAQIDYFNTNFYVHLSIGRWDKSVIIKK